MLELQDINSHYGLSHVIQGISLSLQPGEVLGVFGRNGVGKTTLLKNVAGWVSPSSGKIRLNGVDIGGHAPDAINRAGIAIVPEDRRIFPGLSVQENLELGLLGLQGAKPLSLLDPVLTTFRAWPNGLAMLPRLYQVVNNKCWQWRGSWLPTLASC